MLLNKRLAAIVINHSKNKGDIVRALSILTSAMVVKHIRVNAKNQRAVSRILNKHEKRYDWLYFLIPLVVLVIAVIGMWLVR